MVEPKVLAQGIAAGRPCLQRRGEEPAGPEHAGGASHERTGITHVDQHVSGGDEVGGGRRLLRQEGDRVLLGPASANLGAGGGRWVRRINTN